MGEDSWHDPGVVDLLTALIDGAHETPPWCTFLERVRSALGADYAVINVIPPGRPLDDGLRLMAGDLQSADIAALYRKCFYPPAASRPGLPEEGKPFTLEDLRPDGRATASDAFRELVEGVGVVGSWHIRVVEPNGVEAWLTIASRSRDFTEREIAVLAALAAPLRGVLRLHVAAASSRFTATMASEAVRRLQCGWLLLDEHGHILAADEFGLAVLETSRVLSRNTNGRLAVRPSKLERELLGCVDDLANGRTTRPRAISLRADPWLDMLVVPARKTMISDTAVPAVIAYIHHDNWRSADRCSQLCDLFDLSPSEGRLALALCRGKTIAEAAGELGLALETARSYSKAIYAKTGTRGMVDLVRVIMGSVLALAPET